MNANKPLDRIIVVDFTQAFSGPYCTMMLADNGARVIKIERKGIGDMLRDAGPFDNNNNSLYFASGNRGKESIALDFKNDDDRSLAWALIRKADILVENFRPGVMDKLGFSYDKVKELNSKIVYASISGFGHTGPQKHEPGFDMVAQGYSGIMSVNGELDGNSLRIGVSIGDMAGGVFAYMSIMTAMFARERTGIGTRIDVAMLDSLFALMPPEVANYMNCHKTSTTRGNAHPCIAPFGVIYSSDGELIISVLGTKIWKAYCSALEMPELADNPLFCTNELRLKNRTVLRELTRPLYRKKTTEEWLKIFKKFGVPCAKVNNVEDACNMEQIKERNMLCKSGDYILAGNPMKMSSYEDNYIKGKIPELGEHTDAVRKEFC